MFPSDIKTFVDLFGGSAEVSVNIKADKIIYNDKNKPLVNILNNLDNNFIHEVEYTINKWKLSKQEKLPYLRLRDYYNINHENMTNREKAVVIYCLLTHSFNCFINFNRKEEFNVPFGENRSCFNPKLKDKLDKYIKRISEINIEFLNSDFHNLNLESINKDFFFYADPPYLISCGAYQRDYFCKWSESYEQELLNTLDLINQKGCKFALSNVLTHKGVENTLLKELSKKYNVHHLASNYNNCNYHRLNTEIETDEVLITNY